MIQEVLSNAIVVSGLVVMVLLARKNRWGWALSLLNQFAWAGLAYVTGIWGFAVGAVAFGVVAVHGWLKWKPSSPAKRFNCDNVGCRNRHNRGDECW